MWKLYSYVGPPSLAKHANSGSPRLRVDSAAALIAWMSEGRKPRHEEFVFTFVVLADGLWVADRHSEHIACARGAPVYSAGEITFEMDPVHALVEVVDVTNQSTGYCPQPESWPAVGAALDAAGIAHPGGFSVALIFRRCPKCSATNIVKDGWFECAICGASLPHEWNYAEPAAV